MDQRPKCKARDYKTPRGKRRQNTLWDKSHTQLREWWRWKQRDRNSWDLITLKRSSSAKGDGKRDENIYKGATNTGLISKTYTNSLRSETTKKPNDLGKKWAEGLNRHVSPKKTHRWLGDRWEDAQHGSLSERSANQNYSEVSAHTSQSGTLAWKLTDGKGRGRRGPLPCCW